LEKVRIVDAAPTLLADLGLRFPASIQGKVIDEIFLCDPADDRHYLPEILDQESGQEYNPQEDEAISNRLRQMGYL